MWSNQRKQRCTLDATIVLLLFLLGVGDGHTLSEQKVSSFSGCAELITGADAAVKGIDSSQHKGHKWGCDGEDHLSPT